jgi:hypothetical protein
MNRAVPGEIRRNICLNFTTFDIIPGIKNYERVMFSNVAPFRTDRAIYILISSITDFSIVK